MISDARWSFASRVLVRMAGLPASWLLDLQSTTATRQVRDILLLEESLRLRRDEYLGWIGEQKLGATAPATIAAANRAARLVRRLRPVPTGTLPTGWAERLEPWNAIAKTREQSIAAASASWPAESRALEKALRRIVSRPALQEAVFLNSPDAMNRLRLFAEGRSSNKLRRLAIRYVQRFCIKVETGGFYGPINYGRFDPDSPSALTFTASGDGRTARRHVLLSHWTAQAIASRWAQDDRLAGLLRLYRTARDDSGIGPEPEPRLMALATGEHTLESISLKLDTPLEVLRSAALDAERRGWLRLGIRVPIGNGDPLAALQNLVAGSATAQCAGLMDELARVAGLLSQFEKSDLRGRERLLAEGDELIASMTEKDPRRGAGTFYADRFWYTEEAVGNLGLVTFGKPVLDRLVSDLAPGLDILASRALDERESQHEAIRDLAGSSPDALPAERLVRLSCPDSPITSRPWAALALTDGRLHLTRSALRESGLIRDDLDEWPLFCAPDVMLIARDTAQLNTGHWQIVLAETHHICPPTQLPFATFEPEPTAVNGEIWRAIRSLVGPAEPLLQGIDRQNKTRDYTPVGHNMLWLDWQASEPRTVSVRVGDCAIDFNHHGRPTLRHSDGKALALFPEYDEVKPDVGMLRAVALPGIDKGRVTLAPMTPRITIGSTVFQRARWDLTAPNLPKRYAQADSFAEYLDAWRWKTAWKMPDQVFVHISQEEKPLFLDFCSPLSVDAFLRSIARTDRLGVTEMLPGFDDLWLEIEGQRYCCELRLTAFRQGARNAT